MSRREALVVIGVGASLGFLACSAPKASDKASIRLGWLGPFGYHAPFYYGADLGLYREQGIDVEIKEGQGSPAAFQVVASGVDTFAFADAAVLANAVKTGMPLIMVAALMQQTVFGILVMEKSAITKPKDLEGKTLAITPGGAGETVLPAFLAANGVDAKTVKYVNVDVASKNTVIIDGKVDGSVTMAPLVAPRLQADGHKVQAVSYSKFGINLLANGIVTTKQTVQSKPELVKRFVAATQKSWEASQKDPDAAIAATKKVFPDIPVAPAKQELIIAIETLHTKNTQGKPTGWMAEADWQDTLRILTEYGGLQSPPPISDLYTNQFIS